MQTTVTLPFDILTHITDVLAEKSDNETLRALSQTCKSMVPPCRRYIFSSISLSSAPEKYDLINFLIASPNITRRIQKLECSLETRTNQDIFDILKVMRSQYPPSLHTISLTSPGIFDWDAVQEPTKALLISLMQLPTVTHLKLELMGHFPYEDLSLCRSLTDISIFRVYSQFHGSRNFTRSKIPTPLSLYMRSFGPSISILMRPPGRKTIGPIIDFSHLEKASFDISEEDEALQMAKLLKTAKKLQKLSIEYEEQPEHLRGLGLVLVENAYRTLRSIQLKFTVSEDHDDPLCGLTLELRQLSGNNVLEELYITVLVGADEPCRTDSGDWSDLDIVLTSPGAFDMLRQVAVNLFWYSHERDDEEVDNLLNKLTQDQFPRLLESSEVQFKLYEQHEYV